MARKTMEQQLKEAKAQIVDLKTDLSEQKKHREQDALRHADEQDQLNKLLQGQIHRRQEEVASVRKLEDRAFGMYEKLRRAVDAVLQAPADEKSAYALMSRILKNMSHDAANRVMIGLYGNMKSRREKDLSESLEKLREHQTSVEVKSATYSDLTDVIEGSKVSAHLNTPEQITDHVAALYRLDPEDSGYAAARQLEKMSDALINLTRTPKYRDGCRKEAPAIFGECGEERIFRPSSGSSPIPDKL